jgi:hypothetical protein
VRYDTYKTDKYAQVIVDGRFRYSAGPGFSRIPVTVGFSAYEVFIYDESGSLIAKHQRLYGNMPRESVDPAASLRLLIARPGGWLNSRVRYSLPEDLRTYLDNGEQADLKSYLITLAEATEVSDWPCAVEAAWSVLRSKGYMARTDVAVYARRLWDGAEITYDEPVDLITYDQVFASLKALPAEEVSV